MITDRRSPSPFTIYHVICLTVLVIALVACTPDKPSFASDGLPPGDAARGETLFTQSVNGAPPCSTCHKPESFQGYVERTEFSVTDQSVTEYTFNRIVHPTSGVMYPRYGDKLSLQDIADLIAFVMSH